MNARPGTLATRSEDLLARPARLNLFFLLALASAIFLGGMLLPAPAKAQAGVACSATGAENVWTELAQYLPSETARLVGEGFPPSCDVTVVVVRPDGSIVKGDGSTPGSDVVRTDEGGTLAYAYGVGGQRGTYTVQVKGSGASLAHTTFTGGPYVQTDQSEYYPGATVTVAGAGWQPGESISNVFSAADSPDAELVSAAVADSAGNFTSSEFVTVDQDVGLHLSVTATGSSSGYSTQAAFTVSQQNAAAISTDKEDYAPLETVVVTGTAFRPGETVTLVFQRVNGSGGDDTRTTVADAKGSFTYTSFSPTPNDVGVLFILTATAPSGSFAQVAFTDSAATDCYRTVASGNWNATSTWESAPAPGCSTWTAATLTPTNAASTITIRSPNTVHVTASVPVDQVTVDAGGTLVVDSGVTLSLNSVTGVQLLVNGAMTINGTEQGGGGSGSTYPTVSIGGTVTVAPGGQMNGNNVVGQDVIVTNGGLLDVQGSFGGATRNLTINSNGQATVSGSMSVGGPGTVSVSGDLSVTGTASIGGSPATLTINSGGEVDVSGSLTLASVSNLHVTSGGNLFISGTGAVSGTRGNGGTVIVINGGGTATLSDTATISALGSGTTLSTMRVCGTSASAGSNGPACLVSPIGGTLILGPNAIVAGQNFQLLTNGNLSIGSPAGITSVASGAIGNVQTTFTRSFTTGGNYTYAGVAAQGTGNGLPSLVNNLTIANTGPATVTLGISTTVSGTLSVTSGTLDVGSLNLSTGTTSVSSGATLKKVGSGTFTVGPGGVSNDGTVQMNGGTSVCGEADSLSIVSSSAGVQRAWFGAGVFNIADAAVQDQGGSASITALSSTNNGNNDANWTFVASCDITPPDTSITSHPSNPSNSASASFGFMGSDDTTPSGSLTFDCQLDGGGFSVCTSPASYSGLGDGSHTFDVRARDAANNVDATPASFTWVIDTVAPDTSITSNPSNPSNSSSASFGFTSDDAGATFECQLDGAGFGACTSPQGYSALGDGSHTFDVRAKDAANNVDPTPASFTWTIDTAPPDTVIDTGPTGTVGTNSASFTFHASETSSFECDLDGGGFAGCASPQSYPGPLADGSHTFQVRATDSAGNTDASPASQTWTVDTTPPDTFVDSGPVSPTNDQNPSFTFSSDDPGATFECQLDGGGFSVCTTPQSYSSIGDGSHTFEVRAKDAVGNTDASPASFTWTIDTTAPDTILDSMPVDPTNQASANFTFHATEPSSTLECDLDGGGFAACDSPATYTGLADGSHTFQVRAIDSAGNVDPTPASFTWTVDTSAPNTLIDSAPGDPTNSNTATFMFHASEGSTFQCSLDGAPFASCTSPQSYIGLGEGGHTFDVEATDSAGNTDPTPGHFAWTVDMTAPDTTITSGPAGGSTTSSTSATFEFTGSDTVTPTASLVFECQLDAGGFAACTSPVTYSGLADGSHTFDVRARDEAGNTDVTPDIRTWTISATTTYSFTGFFAPVDNPPTFNSVKAGAGVPVKFGLGGNQGLNIFAAGYPVSQRINCVSTAPIDVVEVTVTAGSSSLQYDAASGQYIYVWKTDKAWAGTCRQLTVRFNEGTTRTANFMFK